MKRILALALVLSLVFVLVSCGKTLSGTYVNDGLLADTTYEFKGKKVTITVGTVLGDKSFEGEYKIAKNDDGKLEITFTFADGDASDYSKTHSFEETDNGIKIGGVEYKKK